MILLVLRQGVVASVLHRVVPLYRQQAGREAARDLLEMPKLSAKSPKIAIYHLLAFILSKPSLQMA